MRSVVSSLNADIIVTPSLQLPIHPVGGASDNGRIRTFTSILGMFFRLNGRPVHGHQADIETHPDKQIAVVE